MLNLLEVLLVPALACILMLLVLTALGTHVLRRQIIFIDIALAQIVAVGEIWIHVHYHAHHDSLLFHAATFGLAAFAAAFYALVRWRIREIPLEAVIGISYVVAAAGALFIVGVDVGGHLHIQHMLSGGLLWIDEAKELIPAALVFLTAGILVFVFHRGFTRSSVEEGKDDHASTDPRTLLWDFFFYLIVGAVITMSVRMGGVVIVFSLLIIPATIGVSVGGHGGRALLAGWGAGVLACLLGMLFARWLDFSFGPSVTLFLGIELGLVALWKNAGMIPGAICAFLAMGGYVGLLAANPLPETVNAEITPCEIAPPGDDAHKGHHHSHVHEETADDPVPLPEELLKDADTPEAFLMLYREARDEEFRLAVVKKAMEMIPATGRFLVSEFLKSDPPLFFGMEAVEIVEEQLGRPFEYDINLPASAPSNQKALNLLKSP